MNFKDNVQAFKTEDFDYGYIWCRPLSDDAINQLEALGGTVRLSHNPDKDPEDYRKVGYRVTFPNTNYGMSIIKGNGTYGGNRDQFEVGITWRDAELVYDTDITNDVLGFMEEQDVLAIARLVLRLDEHGRIKPLPKDTATSQNEQLL